MTLPLVRKICLAVGGGTVSDCFTSFDFEILLLVKKLELP